MAVKPLTQPEYWATDDVYTTGPFIGQPQKVVPPGAFAAEGHRPGALFPTPAEYENSQQYNITGLARWTFAGSSAGAADAHIVETNAAGRSTLHGLTVNDLVDETAVAVFSAATGLNPAVLVTCVGGATAIAASIANSGGAGFQTATGSGAGATGLQVDMSGTPNTGDGVRVIADNTVAAPTIRVEHAGSGLGLLMTCTGSGIGASLNSSGGTGIALQVFGNSTIQASAFLGGAGQAAISAVGGSDATAAVGVAGTGTSIGLIVDGGNGSSAATGMRGTAVHADATGVHGRTSTSASTSAVGVLAEGRGSGTTGLLALNQVGRAAVFQGDASSPAYAATRWVPQNDDPSAGTNDGEVFWHADHRTLRTSIAGAGWRSMLCMGPGSALYVVASQNVNTTHAIGVGETTVLVANCVAADGTGVFKNGGGVLISFTADVRVDGVAPETLNLWVRDTTAGSTDIATFVGTGGGASDGFLLSLPTNDWGQRPITFQFPYTGMTDGDMEISVVCESDGGVNLEMRSAAITIVGTLPFV